MELTRELLQQGFLLQKVNKDDLDAYMDVKRACYRKYVDEYYGGWVEEEQIQMNAEVFMEMMQGTCFQKIIWNGAIAGFFAYDEEADKIDNISIQMTDMVQHKRIGSLYLKHITSFSRTENKPIFLKVFRSNPAQNLYKRFGFEVYGETQTHYLMRFTP